MLLLPFCSISSTSFAHDKVLLQLAFSATDSTYNMQLLRKFRQSANPVVFSLFLGFLSSGFSAICELQLAFTATDNTYNMQLLSSKHSAICEPCCLQFVSAVSLLSLFSNLLFSVCFCVQQIVFSSQFRVDAMLTFVLHLIYFIQMSFRVFACDSILASQ